VTASLGFVKGLGVCTVGREGGKSQRRWLKRRQEETSKRGGPSTDGHLASPCLAAPSLFNSTRLYNLSLTLDFLANKPGYAFRSKPNSRPTLVITSPCAN